MAKVNKVLYNIDQRNDTTAAEKKTARDNIGAGTGNSDVVLKTTSITVPPVDTPATTLQLFSDGRLRFDNSDVGVIAPYPSQSDTGKILSASYAGSPGRSFAQWIEAPKSVVYVSTSDTYATVKGHVDAGKEVVLRVHPSDDLFQDFYLSQVNPDGSMEFYCTRAGTGYVIEYQYVLRTNDVWSRLDTSVHQYNGILIEGIGRNLHLNQNNYVQTNFPGGLFEAPNMSNDFERLNGSDFAGAYMLGCRHNPIGTYELALVYTASGMTGTYTFIGTETVIGVDDSVTVNQAAYIGLTSYYTPSQRFGGSAATPFNPTIHKAILYSGLAEIGPTSNTQIAIWNDNGTIKIAMTSIEVGKVGSTV